MIPTLAYERDEDENIYQRHTLETGAEFRIVAQNVRRSSTGVHARIDLEMSRIGLAFDVFNVERGEDRRRLAGRALKQMDKVDLEVLPANQIEKYLDDFCSGLWQESRGQGSRLELLDPDPEWRPNLLLENFIIEGGGTILFAPPGKGKSYTMLLMAAAMDAGQNHFWHCKQRKVLYVNVERSRQSMAGRLAAVNRVLGLEERRPLLFINAKGHSLTDLASDVRLAMRKHKTNVLFLDSISRIAGGKSLKDDDTANSIIDDLHRLSDTWTAIGHTPRENDGHVFGSQHFDAGMDIGVKLTAELRTDLTGIALKVTKGNDVPVGKTFVFAQEWEDGRLVGIRRSTEREFPELGRKGIAEEVADYILEVRQASATEVARAINRERSRVAHILREDSRFTPVGKIGREVMYGVKTGREMEA